MKYLALILLVALVAGQVLTARITENDSMLQKHERVKRALDDKLKEFLENVKTLLREGNATLGVPVMDPYRNQELSFSVNEEQFKGKAQLKNFEVDGLAAYNVDKSKIKIGLLKQKVTIGLTWPHIFSKGLYNFDIRAFNKIEASGDGEYEITLTDLSFETSVTIKTTGEISITEMQTSISLGALQLAATGIFGDEDISAILSEVISDVTPQMIEDYQREITDAVNAMVTKVVNKELKGKSLKDILAMLG